jgi:alpha-tubulin suppressor-like RCC1 family protein
MECWGNNFYGQLGNGLTTDSNVPVAVTGLNSGVSAIAAGTGHTCAIVSGGVYCWGSNSNGQLGDGTTIDSVTPVVAVGLASGAVGVAVGAQNTCAVLANGAEKCWGDDHYGQLGDGRFLSSNTPQVVVLGDEIFFGGFEN